MFINKKNLFVLLIIFVAVSIFLPSSFVKAAGTPTIMSYQGRLTNSGGNLLTGTYYFKFSIWNVNTGGSSGTNRLWPTADPSSVTAATVQGVFNVDIGDTANGYPDTLNYNFNTSSDIFLQVEVSSDNITFQTLSPRQRISSTAFAQISGAVNGVGQSSFGTLTPVSNAIVTIESTTTTATPLFIRGYSGQTANLLSVQDSSSNHLFSIDSLGGIFSSSTLVIASSTNTSFIVNNSGNVGIGTGLPNRKLNVLDTNSSPQLRLSQNGSVYSEFYTDSTGDVQFSSTGGNIRLQDENLWICSGGSCGANPPVGKGNIVVENAVVFDNNFKFKQTDASTTIMYDSANNPILEFDEGQ